MNDEDYKKKIAEVGARFRAKCQDYSNELSTFADLLRSDAVSTNDETVTQINMLVHGIAGSAATFGYPELGELAVKVEQHLSDLEASQAPSQTELLAYVDQLTNRLRQVSTAE